jgi:hypothetical protein
MGTRSRPHNIQSRSQKQTSTGEVNWDEEANWGEGVNWDEEVNRDEASFAKAFLG